MGIGMEKVTGACAASTLREDFGPRIHSESSPDTHQNEGERKRNKRCWSGNFTDCDLLLGSLKAYTPQRNINDGQQIGRRVPEDHTT